MYSTLTAFSSALFSDRDHIRQTDSHNSKPTAIHHGAKFLNGLRLIDAALLYTDTLHVSIKTSTNC